MICHIFGDKTEPQSAAVAAADEIKAQVISFLLRLLSPQCSVNNLDVINNTPADYYNNPSQAYKSQREANVILPLQEQEIATAPSQTDCNRNHIKIMYKE